MLEPSNLETRPRLTTPDLEFDYDKSQLRDPRSTPGRVARPRRIGMNVSATWKAAFYIPQVTKRSNGSLARNKDEIYREQYRMDPSDQSHSLYVCHEKGIAGSPTYDAAGFQLDWQKVDKFLKPKACSRRKLVRSMEKRIEKAQKENLEMINIFFENGKPPADVHPGDYEPYMKDQVSKDLYVPFHQITPEHFKEWAQKGFPKVKADSWWHEPSQEERRRMLNMAGGMLRKDLSLYKT